MPGSLRLRLLAGMLITLLLTWITLLFWYSVDAMREKTGEWDAKMMSAAQMALLSLPQGVEKTAAPKGYTLQGEVRTERGNSQLSVQAWSLADGRPILRTPNAPAMPLIPSMRDGLGDRLVGREEWRVYGISDADRRIQIQVGRPLSELRGDLHERLFQALLIMGLLFVLLACVVGWVIDRMLSPVVRMSNAIRERSALDLQPLPPEGLPSELRPLIDAFNQLLSRLDVAVQHERRFLVDVAHELRTPLAVLMVQAGNALRSKDPQEVYQSLLKLRATTQRSARLSEQLLSMARTDADLSSGRTASVNLQTVLQLTAHEFESMVLERNQTLLLDAAPCIVQGDIDSLGILLRNLLDNAIRYSGCGGRIEVSCRYVAQGDRWEVLLSVLDEGPGIPEEYRESVFERFYRIPGTQEHGSGIGLSLVEQIASQHDARVKIGPGLGGRGLGVSVCFRAVDADSDRQADHRSDKY